MDCASFVFPAVRGIQATREYYISMVPLEVIPRIFQFYAEELPPEIRAQRTLNRTRIPEMCSYIVDNPDSYIFSSLTVSVDGDMCFDPLGQDDPNIGYIRIPMNSRFLINDGQHRQAAIAEAIKKRPELKNEHISVVFFKDRGLAQAQQMFSDLNRYAIRPTRSINILFSSREESSIIAKSVIEKVDIFKGRIEKERTTISNRSKALFTLSAVCTATEVLLRDIEIPLDVQAKADLAAKFWSQVENCMPIWNKVKTGELKPADIRHEYICSLSVVLVAIGAGGNALIRSFPGNWERVLSRLDAVDWSKDNPVWQNLIFINGRVAANRSTQKAISNYFIELLTKGGDK